MTLYMIGLGLGDEKDITLRGLEAVKKCDYVYLESYTSRLSCDISAMEALYGKKIIVSDRELVEKSSDEMLTRAKEQDVAFLVIGDVFGATTHTDLRLRAMELGVDVRVMHNASILTAVGDTGLELYKFGKVTSIPFENENVETPYDVLKKNQSLGMHTLFLLDLRPDEGRFMSVSDALSFLFRVEEKRQEKLISAETKFVGCAGLGTVDSVISYGTFEQLKNVDFGSGLHCVILPGNLHFMEEDLLKTFE